jgi:hypothetical protein
MSKLHYILFGWLQTIYLIRDSWGITRRDNATVYIEYNISGRVINSDYWSRPQPGRRQEGSIIELLLLYVSDSDL